MTMSDKVRKAISKCSKTQYAIAQETGVNKGALSRFMAGKQDMTLRTLEKLAGVIGVELVLKSQAKK